MVTEDDARLSVLALLHDEPGCEHCAVESCTLTPLRDYWIVRANSAAYVLHGDLSKLYVGVNAYLVDTCTREIEIVGSGWSVDQYLQEKYDLREAAGRHYVLCAGFSAEDKKAIILLRQKLECSLQRARTLAQAESRWVTGTRAALLTAQTLLRSQGVPTLITLVDDPLDARLIDRGAWHWDALKRALQ